MQSAGIEGCGGAGFPSYAKLNEKADTIILNCAECEPLLKLHRQVLKKYAEKIMLGLESIRAAVGADRAIVAIKPSAKHTIEAIKYAIIELNSISIGLLPEVYPAGDEVIAIYETTGRVVKPGALPISVGVIVYNVETVLNTYYAIENGAPVTGKYVTITGAVKNPATLYLPLGVAFSEVIDYCGGATIKDYALVCGGPMTGRVVSIYDVVTKTTNGLIILPENHPVVLKKTQNLDISLKRGMSACCQCRMCTDLCPRHLLGHPIEPHKFMRNITTGNSMDVAAYEGTLYCSSCGLCEMYSCFQGLSPRSLIGLVKVELKKSGYTPGSADYEPVNPIREYRRISKNRLIARLGLNEYNHQCYLDETEYPASSVKIMLNQHIGAKSIPIVKENDMVKKGDVIANAIDGALSLPTHSSISGRIVKVTDSYITVER